ncbi:hypothetical protein DSM112329_03366 [Paraconexibacter sp. AEG42_29]|uniref:DUF4331 domain-containing protein n=1 Tax=Paraconexibacter sp. AEG42_29 TaxID=2997339 RepID=A0AAU7AYD5_9ACTN
MNKLSVVLVVLAVPAAAGVAVSGSSGSSHREAPNIMLDPSADNTDTYAFKADDAPEALTVVANWVPGGNPANGPNFFRFDDRARYYISIDNTGDGRADIRYRYVFKSTFSSTSYRQARSGVQSIDDPKLQTRQTYSIVRETLVNGRSTGTTQIASGLPVAPGNAGPKTFPNYAKVANQAIRTIGRSKYFAGQRNDAFFIDLGVAFDNVNLRLGLGNTGGGIDTQAGTSIQTITMQVPEEDVTRDGKAVGGPDDANATVGVWASTERRKVEVTNARFDKTKGSRGGWVQVSRLGNPLVNELFIPAALKDRFNATTPDKDAKEIQRFVLEPEVARQINEVKTVNALGIDAPEKNRTDLVSVFLTGMPGLNQIDKAKPTPADTLKINLGIPPARTPNRFGVIGGDDAGFPNGRRLADDATDIYIQMVAGFLQNRKLPLGDGVDQDDRPFLPTFPYQSVPDNGFNQRPSQRIEPPHLPTLPGDTPPIPIGPQIVPPDVPGISVP